MEIRKKKTKTKLIAEYSQNIALFHKNYSTVLLLMKWQSSVLNSKYKSQVLVYNSQILRQVEKIKQFFLSVKELSSLSEWSPCNI